MFIPYNRNTIQEIKNNNIDTEIQFRKYKTQTNGTTYQKYTTQNIDT